jgi:hypothetical protein
MAGAPFNAAWRVRPLLVDRFDKTGSRVVNPLRRGEGFGGHAERISVQRTVAKSNADGCVSLQGGPERPRAAKG